jgi:hypothetical protein
MGMEIWFSDHCPAPLDNIVEGGRLDVYLRGSCFSPSYAVQIRPIHRGLSAHEVSKWVDHGKITLQFWMNICIE